MKFLSDILAKAGLTVDGVVTFNNTATGQTPATNDNSTKLATTAFIKNQSYLTANQTITVSGDATGSGTTSIALTLANSGVIAGTYGNASNIPTIVVDAKGRITSISTNAVSIITTLAGLSDVTLTSPSANQVLQYNGTRWVNGAAPTTYTLPIASASVLGGIKVGSGLSIDSVTGVLTASGGGGGNLNFRTIQEFTATAGQTTFTIAGGYNVGYVEVFINGVYISESQYTATNGSTIVLNDPVSHNDIVTVFLFSLYNLGESNYARNVDTLTATAGQTTFSTSYIPGQIDVYYNGSKLNAAEFTATNGSSIILAQAAVLGDIIEVVTYLAGAGLNANRTLTINGTTYDLTANRTWTLTTSNIAEGTNLYYTDARVSTYLTTNSYATQSYVGTQLANLVASAPSTLDTLNELAAALGNDPSFATTIATSIGTKVPQTRTITINGTAYDLTADRSWTIASGVTSFNTRTGAITAASGDYTTAQVTESGNLYYTDTRVRAAISLTTTGTSGAATYDSATGIFNIPQYQGGVTSFNTRTGAITLSSTDVTTALTYTPVTNARTITINGTSYDLSANRSWTIAPDVSVRNTYAFTATANQTTFTVSGGYTVGLVDVFINGVKLAAADFTATNGTTVVLATGTGVGNIVEIVKYVSAFTTAVETTRTLTINGTTYDLSANRTWSIDNASLGAQPQLNGTGLVRMSGTTVSYDNATYATQSYVTTAVANLVNAAPSTLDTLNELAAALGNDANFATTITTSIGTKQAQLNGTGFVKVSGTTISYDNSTYLTTASATSTYLPLAGGIMTGDIQMGNNQNRIIKFRTATAWDYSLKGINDDFFITDNPGLNYLALYYNTGGNNRYASLMNVLNVYANGSSTFSGSLSGTSASFSSTLKVGGAVGNFLIDSYTTSKIGIRSWTDIAGTTNNFFLQNNASYNYGILGVVSASGTATGDVYGLGYTPSAGTSMTPVINWTSAGNAWSTGIFGVGVSPYYGTLDVRSSSTSISTLDGVAGFFKNTPKGGGLTIRVHDTQVDLAATWFYGSTNMDLTLTTVGTDAVYRERIRIQASDGAMAFNTSITGVRSYLFKALPGRQLAIEALESGGVHSIYLRPSGSGRHLIASNYFSGGVYLPLALSGRENDADMVLHPNGNIAIASATDIGTKLQVNGANYVEMATFACTTASASDIVANNGGIVQFSSGNARHCSNTSLFVPVTNGIQITKPGILYVSFSQDITTAGSTGYVAGYISKNGSNISENLITNTGGQWDGITGVTTINVNASDIIGFNFNAADILSFDPNTWSNYSFIWTSR